MPENLRNVVDLLKHYNLFLRPIQELWGFLLNEGRYKTIEVGSFSSLFFSKIARDEIYNLKNFLYLNINYQVF